MEHITLHASDLPVQDWSLLRSPQSPSSWRGRRTAESRRRDREYDRYKFSLYSPVVSFGMGQFSRNLMVIAFLERTYCVPSSAMCAGHTSPDIELQARDDCRNTTPYTHTSYSSPTLPDIALPHLQISRHYLLLLSSVLLHKLIGNNKLNSEVKSVFNYLL